MSWAEDRDARGRLLWVKDVLKQHTNLFACWCTTDERGVSWLLGLFDEHFCGGVSIYDGRHSALLTSPYITLTDLPATRTPFREQRGPAEGFCLTLEHYSGMHVYFKHYVDGSVGVAVDTKEGLGCPLDITVPDAVVREYLACLSVDPTRWHERPGWIRNPRPYDCHTWRHGGGQEIEDLDVAITQEDRARTDWFTTVKDELLRRFIATL